MSTPEVKSESQETPVQVEIPQKVTDLVVQNPEMFMTAMGLLKASTDRKSAGIAAPPLRGFTELGPQFVSARGIRENLPPINHRTLRTVTKRNPVVAAILNTRCRQMRPFSKPCDDEDEPGYRIGMRDEDAKPTKKEKDEIKYLQDWFQFSGRTDFEGWEERDDNLNRVMVKLCRDFLEIDQGATEIRRDRAGSALDFWTLDSSTIRRVKFSGLVGDKSDVDPRLNMGWSELEEHVAKLKIQLIPDLKKVRYVQMIEDRIVAAYTPNDLVFEVMNERTDLKYAGYGYPLVEQAMSVITAFIFALAYNTQGLDQGTLPKVALVFKEGNFGEEALMRLQDSMLANFQGHYGPWRIPMLSGDVDIKDFYKSPRELEYMKFLEFAGAVTCAVYGIDPLEMGLQFQQSKSALGQGAQKSRQKFSKDRGLDDLLGCMRMFFNKMMRLMRTVNTGATNKAYRDIEWRKYIFEYTGVRPQDLESKSKRDTEAVQRDTTVNELRKEQDKPPLKYGDIILNPAYIQYVTGKEQAEQMQQQEAEGGEPEFDFGEEAGNAVDEAFAGFGKADKPIRTLLK